MAKDEKIVAIGLLTAPEFRQWGDKLRHVYSVDANDQFADLLKAIDEADATLRGDCPQPGEGLS